MQVWVQEQEELTRGASALGVELTQVQIEMLISYIQLLYKWNKAYNLTAIKDPGEMVKKHLLDSLAVVPLISEKRVIDVGTGGGLPGIPMAILQPEQHVCLLDSRGKKIRFLSHVKRDLQLNNVSLINGRVEEYIPENTYDVVVTRAFSSLRKMTELCEHLLSEGGCFKAMKGPGWRVEAEDLPPHIEVKESCRLNVPGLNEERWLVTLASTEKI